MTNDIIKFDDGNVYMWIEDESSIMIKACTKKYNDPVELNSLQAREIANSLLKMADSLDGIK